MMQYSHILEYCKRGVFAKRCANTVTLNKNKKNNFYSKMFSDSGYYLNSNIVKGIIDS